MSDLILALHAGHNASACIGGPDGTLFAVQEERLTGEKNYWGFPERAIRACMSHANARTEDIAAIACGGHQVLCRRHRREDILEAYRRQETMAGRLRQRIAMPLVLALKPDYGQDVLSDLLKQAGLEDVPRIHYDHHQSHALSAYYGLRRDPNRRYLVVTADGSGDSLCGSVRVMVDGREQVIATCGWDDSLGALYAWVTYALGFVPLEHEYKLMGMAPYASQSAAEEMASLFRSYLWLDEKGLRFQRRTKRRINDISQTLFEDLRGKRFDHICAGLQLFTEEILTTWIRNAIQKTGVHDVLAAGGVFMNVKANKVIGEMDQVESFDIFPSCGDETLPFGAFYGEAAKRWGHDAIPPLSHLYLGADLDPTATEQAVRESGFRFEKPENMADTVAGLLASGKPVARCAGPMEFGARALGNRSILADPSNQDVVRVINQMVKKRDFWMPFAPMVLEDRQSDYLLNPKGLRSPFMMMTFDTKEESFRDLIAAVHNADLTCRAQILERQQNEPLHDILCSFAEKTGRGVVLNTSFNLHGFPIVHTAADAIHVLRNSGLEYLQAGDWLVYKTV